MRSHGTCKPPGKEVVGFSSFQIEDNEEMAALTSDAIYRAALIADRPEADALFISCTAIRAVEVIDRDRGAPGQTGGDCQSGNVLALPARVAGCDLEVPGHGALMRAKLNGEPGERDDFHAEQSQMNHPGC